jgi:hypothetical protein
MMTYHDDVRLHLFVTHCINHFERRGPGVNFATGVKRNEGSAHGCESLL